MMKHSYDRCHFNEIKFDHGEIVVMLRQPTPGVPSKYREKALQVIEVLPRDTYCVAEMSSDGSLFTFATTAYISHFKSWKILQEDAADLGPELNDLKYIKKCTKKWIK